MRTGAHKAHGFTLVEIMIVVTIIGLLASIAVPNFVQARTRSQANGCIENLRQMDAALQEWALDNRKKTTDTYTVRDLRPYLKANARNRNPSCPGGGRYLAGATVTNSPTCTLGSSNPAHALP